MFSLTVPQQNIWNLQRFYEGTSISNVCGAFFFNEKCKRHWLNEVINKLLALQGGLRLRFAEVADGPMQYESAYEFENFPYMDFKDMASFDNNIHISNTFTIWFMNLLGFEWREIDKEYLFQYIEYFRKIGYFMIPAPKN